MNPLPLKSFTVIIFSLILSNFAFANGQRAEDTLILDIDASGEVDAMTDGLLMMRSMFGFTDDVLVDGAVAEDCTECDPAQIQEHISMVKGMTISQLNSAGEPGPAGPQGEKGEKGDKGDIGPTGPAGPAGALDSSLENITIENLSVIGTTSLNGLAVMGSTTIENELSVMGSSSLMGPTFIEDELRVMGPTRLDHLNVMGDAFIDNELRVFGPLRSDYLDVMGNTNLGDLAVSGSIQVTGPDGNLLELYREGSVTPNNIEVGPEGLLNIDTPVTLQRNLEVKGATTFEGSTQFFGPTTLMMGPEEKLSVEGTTELNELRVMGSSSLIGPTVIEDELRIIGPVTGTVRIEDELRVMGPSRLMGPTNIDFLDVMGNTNLGELRVHGSTRLNNLEIEGTNGSLLSVYREGAITPNDVEVGSEGLLEIASPATFQNNLEVMGTSTFKGLTTFEGPTTLTMAPDEQFSVDGTTELSELRVMGPSRLMGPTNIDFLDVMGSTSLGELSVNGSARLGEGPNGPLLGVYSEGSTSHNGNQAGPEGLLEVTSSATFQNELRVMGPLRSDYLDVMGNTNLGELRVHGSTRLNNLEIEGTNGSLLSVYREGAITPNDVEVDSEGLLEVASPAIFQNNLNAKGSTTFEGTATFKGSTIFEGPTTLTLAPEEQFSVQGSTTLNDLNVMGPSSLTGPTFIEDELRVMGPTRLDHLNVMGDAFIDNELRVFGPLRSDYLDVMGNTNLGDLAVSGSIQVTGPDGNLLELYREGSVTPNNIEVGPEGLLNIDTPVTLQRNLEVKGATTFEGSTQFFGPTTLMMGPEEKLSVEGTTELNELRVMGSSSLIGPTVIEDELRIIGPVTGTVRIEDELRVMGPSRLMGPTNIDFLDVMGNTNLGELRVHGSTRLNNLEIEGTNGSLLSVYREGAITPNDVEVGSEGLLEVASPATFQNNLEVMGTSTFKGLTTFEGPTTLTMAPDEQFSVDGTTELSELRVMGPSRLMGPTNIDFLDVMGSTSLGELSVNGSARLGEGPNGPLLGVYSEGSTSHNGNQAGPEGLLEVTSSATFQNELRVMGPLRSDYLDVMGNTNLGELRVHGSTRLNNLEIEGTNGSLLSVYREGAITPNDVEVDSEGLLEVTSPATFQNNLEIMGTSTFKGLTTFEGPTTLTLGPDEQFSVQGTTELSELQVMGPSRLMGPTNIDFLDVMGSTNLGELYVNGSTRLGDSPNGPLLGVYREGSSTYNGELVGPGGLLEVASPATFQNELNVLGLLSSGDLDVIGQTSLGELYVNGSAHLAWGPNGPILGAYREGSMSHNGNEAGPEGLLEVASPATFQNEILIKGPTVIENELRVMGSARLDDLEVMGPTMLMGPTNIDHLNVMGSTNLGGLNVNQDAFFNQNVHVANTLTTMEFALSSDKRIKKDISPTKYDLKSVLKLNPVDYKLKSNNKDQTGFIAQEVQDVIPELVNGVEGDLEKGEILSINYIALIPILTKAIQEQQGQLNDQAATIDALLERIIALEKSSNP